MYLVHLETKTLDHFYQSISLTDDVILPVEPSTLLIDLDPYLERLPFNKTSFR